MTIRRVSRNIIFHIAYHLYAKRKLSKTDTVTLLGFTFTVPPTVFHPGLYFSSKLLAHYLLTQNFAGKKVLDIGCGSGILSVIAASRGGAVTALDINAAAVEATAANALRNSLEASITVKKSSLFDQLDSHTLFDIILFNPPFYTGIPQNISEYAWQGGTNYDLICKVSQQAKDYIKKGGTVVFILSSDMDVDFVKSLFEREEYTLQNVFSKKTVFETFSIIEASYRP